MWHNDTLRKTYLYYKSNEQIHIAPLLIWILCKSGYRMNKYKKKEIGNIILRISLYITLCPVYKLYGYQRNTFVRQYIDICIDL